LANYYDILQLPKFCNDIKLITKNYRDLVKKHHPDKGGDVKKMQEITEAYGVLKNNNKKHEYDKKLKEGNSHVKRPTGSGNINMNSYNKYKNQMDKLWSMQYNINLKAKTSDTSITYKRQIKCNECDGVGCMFCELKGYKTADTTIQIQYTGSEKIVFEGYGTYNKGMQGDLIITFIKDLFKNDIIELVPIYNLYFGCEYIVNINDKKFKFKIPSKTQSGKQFKMNIDNNEIIVTVMALVPTRLNKNELDAMHDLQYFEMFKK
jgi:DnaJ-class molecular chaperone